MVPSDWLYLGDSGRLISSTLNFFEAGRDHHPDSIVSRLAWKCPTSIHQSPSKLFGGFKLVFPSIFWDDDPQLIRRFLGRGQTTKRSPWFEAWARKRRRPYRGEMVHLGISIHEASPIAGWFTMENQSLNGWFGGRGYPHFRKPSYWFTCGRVHR